MVRAGEELNGTWISPKRSSITFEEWATRWLEQSESMIRPSSHARNRAYLRAHAFRDFGDVALGDLTHRYLQGWVAELAQKLAPATVVKHVQVVKKCLREAVLHELIAKNPADNLRSPRVEPYEARFLTPGEVGRLADAIDDRYRALVLAAAYCGPRIGELAALERQSVDLDARRLHITATASEVDGRLVVGRPKTRAGIRAIPIPGMVAAALEDQLASHESRYVFPSPAGAMLRPSAFRAKFFHPAAQRAGLAPPTLHPHDLRHTAVSLWIRAGLEMKAVAARAGHRSIVTVYDRYGHLYPDSTGVADAELDRVAWGG